MSVHYNIYFFFQLRPSTRKTFKSVEFLVLFLGWSDPVALGWTHGQLCVRIDQCLGYVCLQKQPTGIVISCDTESSTEEDQWDMEKVEFCFGGMHVQ